MYGPNLQLHQTHSRCCRAKRNPPISSKTGIPNACRCEWQLTQNTQKKTIITTFGCQMGPTMLAHSNKTHILKKRHHSGQCRSVRWSRLPYLGYTVATLNYLNKTRSTRHEVDNVRARQQLVLRKDHRKASTHQPRYRSHKKTDNNQTPQTRLLRQKSTQISEKSVLGLT